MTPALISLVVGATVFFGAFLLFQVQPVIGKYILPWFGGTPSVWTTCLLCFQLLLLAGYAYAHGITRWLSPRRQAIMHGALLLIGLLLLPITPSTRWQPSDVQRPAMRILWLLLGTIGLPYFLLSATGPLVQSWFGHLQPGRSPYRLYALSNLGSLLALVSYPFWFEVQFTRRAQTEWWSWGMGIFVALCGATAWLVWQQAVGGACKPSEEREAERLEWRRYLWWLILPACAAIVLMATTNRLCQDIAVMPLLWVLPLALYLVTFIICFDSPRWYSRAVFGAALGPAVAAVVWVLRAGADASAAQQVACYCGALFVCGMVCHGELYRLKPHPRYLTAYYLLISAGGALGGVAVAVVAPLVFRSYVELHGGLGLCLVLLFLVCLRDRQGSRLRGWMCGAVGLMAAALCVLLVECGRKETRGAVNLTRNFYGVLSVWEYCRDDLQGHYRVLQHGQISHGLQYTDPYRALLPTAYFTKRSGVGLALESLSNRSNRVVGVVGLGVGTLAAYGKKGDQFRFYEINPAVEHLARHQFRYLEDSSAEVKVILGDARLVLEREPSQQFDLLALDAFSSDAIPVHLLTREAFAVYLRHLKPDGVLAVHTSNRHINLAPVLANVAAEFRLHSTTVEGPVSSMELYDDDGECDWAEYESTWVLLSSSIISFDRASAQKTTGEAAPSPAIPLWTDDYTSVFPLVR